MFVILNILINKLHKIFSSNVSEYSEYSDNPTFFMFRQYSKVPKVTDSTVLKNYNINFTSPFSGFYLQHWNAVIRVR